MIEAQKPHAGLCWLVQVEWASGTLRYFSQPGFVSWDGQNWFASTDTGGTLLSVGPLSEKTGEIAHRDVTFALSPTVRGYLLGGERRVRVTFWECERDPATAELTVKTPPWVGREDQWAVAGGFDQKLTMTIAGTGAILMEPNEGWLFDAATLARLSPDDTGLNLTGPPATTAFNGGGSYGILNGGGGAIDSVMDERER